MAIYYSCLIPDSGELLLIVPQQSGTASSGGFDQLLGVTGLGVPTWYMTSAVFQSTVADWAFVQKAATPGSGAVASQAATFTGATSAGHLVAISAATNATGLTMTASGGNTCTPIAADNGGLYTFYCVVANAGTVTFTATPTGGNAFINLSIREFSTSGTITLATPATASSNSLGTAAAAPITFAGHGLDLGFVQQNSAGNAAAASSGYTLDYSTAYTAGSFFGLDVVYKLNDSSGSATPSVVYAPPPTLKKNGTPIAIGPATWDEGNGPYGGPGTAIAYLLTGGPVLATDTMTVDIPANFVNLSSPAYTSVAVTNGTGGGLEPPFGAGNVSGATGCPGLNATPTARFAADTGAPAVAGTAPNYLLWNQVYRAAGWQWAAGESWTAHQDEYRNMISWTGGKTIRLPFCDIAAGTNGLDARGGPNQPGKWTVVIDDFGTAASTFSVTETTENGTVTFVPGESSTSGTTHTLVYDVQYASSNPTAWELNLWLNIAAPPNNILGASDGLSHWAYGTLGTSNSIFISPPNMADGTAMTVVRTNPFAINPNVRAQLTSGGNTIEHIRQMQSYSGHQQGNIIYLCDIPQVAGFWPGGRTLGPVTANHVRFANTDPAKGSVASGGDGTYNWPASTRVYGPQADFVLSDGVTTALTATLTTGSHAITITAGTPLLAGGLITGTGIPTNTRLAYFSGSSGWLERPATASGSQSLTLHDPGYLEIAPGDDGGFMIDGFGAEKWAVAEMRFDAPHGLSTGYYPGGAWGSSVNTTGTNAVTITNIGSSNPTAIQSPLMVTGPYTIMTAWYAYQGTPATITWSNVNTIVQTTEYDFTATGGWQFNVQVPYDTTMTFAYEAHVAMTADLGCHACYLTFPIWGTDAVYDHIGQAAHQYGNSSLVHRIEVSDEPWNGAPGYGVNMIGRLARQNLYGQQASGTVISEYFTATGYGLPFGQYALAQNVLLTGHAGHVFSAAFQAAGGSSSKVELIAGSQYNDSSTTQENAGSMQMWGVPIKWLIIATYINTPPSNSIAAAYSAAVGDWPLAAINDHARHYHAWNYYEQLFYYDHMQSLLTWGQPLVIPNVVNAGNHGGSFAPSGGGFAFWYTYLDSSGHETTVGQSGGRIVSLGAGESPGWIMPQCLAWVASINVYLGASDWTSQQSFFYVNLTVAGNTVGSEIIFTAAYNTANAHPPTVSSPLIPAGTPPALAGYEGGQVQPVPTTLTTAYHGNQEWLGLTHDVFAHPSAALDIPTWMMSNQVGCQWLPASGLTYSTYYQTWSIPGPSWVGHINNEYVIYAGTGQPPGAGTSNQYALRGSPNDGLDHNGGAPLSSGFNGVPVRNQATRGQGILNWLAGATNPAPTVTATTPTSGATGVSGSGHVSITYSEAMDSTTLTLTLNAASVPFTSYNSGTLTATFTPASSLSPSTSYAAVANGSSATEVAMASPYDWSFTTAAAAAPTVTATTPANSATQVPLNTSITATFSAAMQGGTLTCTITPSGGSPASCTLSNYNSGTFAATFTLPASLANDTVYTASVNGTNTTGTPMASAYSWSFTSNDAAPVVAAVTPTNGTVAVATGSTITATFAGAVNSGSIVFTFTPTLAGTAALSGGVATFTPTSAMPNLTTYSVSLAASAPDGTAMIPYVWGFTTQATPPTVSSTTPASSATGVGPVAAITATFSEVVNPNSLSLTLSPSARVAGPAWNPGTLTATWTPAGAGLAYATGYTATASATAVDGTTMASPYQWSFATHDAPPTGAGLLSSTGFQLTGAVDATSMTVAMTGPSGAVSGSSAYDGTNHLITFSAAAPLTPGARYVVTIGGLKTTGGASIPAATYVHTPGAQKSTGWIGGLGATAGG